MNRIIRNCKMDDIKDSIDKRLRWIKQDLDKLWARHIETLKRTGEENNLDYIKYISTINGIKAAGFIVCNEDYSGKHVIKCPLYDSINELFDIIWQE